MDRKEKENKLRWVGGLILDVSDGNWLMPGVKTRCYAENKAAYVFWDEVQEADCSMCKSDSVQDSYEEQEF